MPLLIEYLHTFGRFQRNARLYLISNALSGVTVGILLLLYNLYLLSLGYKTDFIGLVLFVGIVGAGIAIFPAGLCIDRFSGKAILIWSSAVIGLVGAGQILFRQPVPLLISTFIAGSAGAFVLVVNAPFLTRNSTTEERSHLFSLNIVLGLITTVVGEILGGALPVWFRQVPWLMQPVHGVTWFLAQQAEPRSYQLALLFAGLIAAPSFLPLFLMSDDRPVQSAKAMQMPVQPVPLSSRLQATLALWRKQLVHTQWKGVASSAFFTLVLVQVLIALGAGLFIPYFNVYFVQQLKASPALFGLIDGGANAINALFTLLAPLLALRLGKINTITVTRLISIPLLLTIGLMHVLPLAAILYLFRQGTMDMGLGLFQVYSMEAVAEQRRGVANSTYQVASQVAQAITTPLGGLIIAHMGFTPVFVIGAVFYVLATGVLWWRFGRIHSQ